MSLGLWRGSFRVTIQSVCVIRNSGCCNRVPCSGTTQLRREIMGQEIGASRSSIVGVSWISLYTAIVPIYTIQHCTHIKAELYLYTEQEKRRRRRNNDIASNVFLLPIFLISLERKREQKRIAGEWKIDFEETLLTISNRMFFCFVFLLDSI